MYCLKNLVPSKEVSIASEVKSIFYSKKKGIVKRHLITVTLPAEELNKAKELSILSCLNYKAGNRPIHKVEKDIFIGKLGEIAFYYLMRNQYHRFTEDDYKNIFKMHGVIDNGDFVRNGYLIDVKTTLSDKFSVNEDTIHYRKKEMLQNIDFYVVAKLEELSDVAKIKFYGYISEERLLKGKYSDGPIIKRSITALEDLPEMVDLTGVPKSWLNRRSK